MEEFRKEHGAIIRLKVHPALTEDAAMKLITWKHLPAYWEWEKRKIPELFESVSCAFVMNTSSVIDAVLARCKVITVGRELDLAWNNLDMYENNFNLAQTIKKEDIKARLTDMLCERPQHYSREVSALGKIVEEGLNGVTDDWLEIFINVIEKSKLNTVN